MLSDPRPVLPARTRIKLCGMTRDADIDAAVALGIDAVGFVFYAPSARHVTIDCARRLAARLPGDVDAVGLFVDASRGDVEAVLAEVPLTMLQFHGDESPEATSGYPLPVIKAARVGPGLDLLDFAAAHDDAFALLLDAHSAGYGGSGKVFDWSLVPPSLRDTIHGPAAATGVERRVVLSGGLSAANVAEAIHRVRPWAVDTSSGIERAKGVKDPTAMRDFVAAVRAADRPS